MPKLFSMKKNNHILFCLLSLGAENKQVAVKSLQKRGEVGNQHYYLQTKMLHTLWKSTVYLVAHGAKG